MRNTARPSTEPQPYQRTIDLAREMLESSASVSAQAQRTESGLDVSVTVTNLSGHKLPTGYAEGRQMWLNVRVNDSSGGLLFESGQYDSEEARLLDDEQLRRYEVLHGEWVDNTCMTTEEGVPVFHFALTNCIASDTRIPAAGLSGGQ